MGLIDSGELPEIIAIFLFALYASLLPESHRTLLLLAGAGTLAAFLTWRSRKRIERKNAEAWEKLKAEIEGLNVDEGIRRELLNAIDELRSEVRKRGFAVKVVRLGDSDSSREEQSS